MRDRRGYSLVELLMVVAIIGTIAMVGPRLMIQLQNFYLLTTARAEIQRDARATIDVINRFLRQAKYSTIIIDTPSGEGPYSRIRFTMIDDRAVEFYQDGTKLYQVIDGTTSVTTRNLVYLAFTFPRSDYPRLVSVSITMGKSTYKGQRKELELTVQKIRIMN
ncbi:MAG: type II secretion system protein [Elusimicrobia bacterium]|nr:type II secretion system protein [Elusimicrobiota bacterium]